MNKFRLNIRVNIKRLSPVLNFGAAAAVTSTSMLAMYRPKAPEGVVVNNYIQRDLADMEPASREPIRLETDIPKVEWNGKVSLGQAWSEHLLNADNQNLWIDHETRFSSLPEDSYDRFVHSSMFKDAQKKVKRRKNVNGTILSRACKKAYELNRRSAETEKILSDVWNYCHIKHRKIRRQNLPLVQREKPN